MRRVLIKRALVKIAEKLHILRYASEEKGNALIETVVLFPLMTILLIGCYDLGLGIVLNLKTVGASQIIGDLVTRNREVDMTGLQDMIRAGSLSYEPYSTATFGYDIASIEFDDTGAPVVLWRVTHNMEPNDDAVASTEGLGPAGDGMVVVTTVYVYDPYFTNFVVPEINMEEVAFLKGRMSSTIACDDCPT